jgi:hypothetical protein
MLTTKFHTIYIPLPKNFNDELFAIYKDLSQKYTNEYLNENSWKAHVTIGVLPLIDKDTETFVQIGTRVLAGIKKFSVSFSAFELSTDKRYIFLEPDVQSKEKIMELRKRFEKEIKDKFKIEIPRKYIEKWETYTDDEKERLQQTGSPYLFEPHVSIVKLDPTESENALKEIQNNKILEESFVVDEFHISGQSEDPLNEYPILKKIQLIQ